MSKFSEHLEQCIIDSGMTEKHLAKVSGFNRSYIALMKNGQRVSPDTGKMMKLFQALSLPPYECDKMWSEYIRARVGDDIYERNHAVIDLMESFGSISNTSIKSFYRHEIPDIKTADNRMDLEYLIKAVIEQEAVKRNGSIHIIMQADVPILKNILPYICKNNKELRIDHIICMDSQIGSGYEQDQLYNIKMLKSLMPIVIFSDSENYRIYHYYDCVKSHFSKVSLMPYMVLTDDYVISMNDQMNKGIIFREKEIIALYEKLFQEHKRGCRLLLKRIKDQTDIYDYYKPGNCMGEVVYTIAQQPCFGVLKVEGMVRKYSIRGNEKRRILLENMLRRNEKLISSGQIRTVSYCTKKGLQRFAKEGTVDELPGEMYHKLEVYDRLDILRKLLEVIRQGKYELYLLGEYRIDFPKELIISSHGVTDATLMYLSDDAKARFILNENSLTKTLYEFFQDFAKSPQISSAEKAALYIEQLIEELNGIGEREKTKSITGDLKE